MTQMLSSKELLKRLENAPDHQVLTLKLEYEAALRAESKNESYNNDVTELVRLLNQNATGKVAKEVAFDDLEDESIEFDEPVKKTRKRKNKGDE